MNNNVNNDGVNDTNAGQGYLRIKTSTAGNAFPVSGAIVYIKSYTEGNEDGGDVLYSLRTDEDGLTETVALPAPSREYTLSPGSDKVFSEYNIEIKKDGYYPVENIGVPIFDGVTSIQPVELIPLSENSLFSPQSPDVRFFESGGYSNLRSGGSNEN